MEWERLARNPQAHPQEPLDDFLCRESHFEDFLCRGSHFDDFLNWGRTHLCAKET